MKEEKIIRLFTKSNKNFSNDDCEILPVKKNYISIITGDSLIENVHFKLDWHSPKDLAKKLFQVNLSDIISSGGVPFWCLLQIGLPKLISNDFLYKFSESFLKECKQFNTTLIGGDTFRSQILVLSLTMGGYTKKYIPRKSKPNSYIYATGHFGLSLLGYKILNKELQLPKSLKKIAIKRHLAPKARIDIAKKIYPFASSMMDISDGLVQDLTKMAKASGFQFIIRVEKIPIHKNFKKYINYEMAIASGEEYELVFTSNKKIKLPFITEIGYVTNKKPSKKEPIVKFLLENQEIFPKKGFEHF
ncbi:MAG: thiamine-phosphate kinase [Leptonema sp. (in: bacteria)]